MTCAGGCSVLLLTLWVGLVLGALTFSGPYAAGTVIVLGSPLLLAALLFAVAAVKERDAPMPPGT